MNSKGRFKRLILRYIAAIMLCLLAVGITGCDNVGKSIQPVGKYYDNALLIKQDDKYGYLDSQGYLAIPCIYENSIYDEENDVYRIQNSEGEIGLPAIDSDNSEIKFAIDPIEKKYDSTYEIIDGLILVNKKRDINDRGKWGFIDSAGQEIIPPAYDDAEIFSEGLAAVCKNEKWGFINKNGEVVIPLEYDEVNNFSEGMAAVCKDRKWGFIDETGKEVISLDYTAVYPFTEGVAAAQKVSDGNRLVWIYIDKTGKQIIPDEYYQAAPFSEGLASVIINDEESSKWLRYYIDKTGEKVISHNYNKAEEFSEGLAAVYIDDKWGFIDTTGKEVVPPKYSAVHSFSEGMAAVLQDKKCGFIDKTGKEIVAPSYSFVGDFSEGLATTTHFTNRQYINSKGQRVLELDCYRCGDFVNGLAPVYYEDANDKEMIGWISNPLTSTANKNAVSLSYGVFGNPSGDGYDQLEDGQGNILVKFDEHLINCNRYFAEGLQQLSEGNVQQAEEALQKALTEQPDNPYILHELQAIEQQNKE